MRFMIAVIVVVVAIWSAWWWLGSSAHQLAWDTWLEDRGEQGWVAEADEAQVRGYPSRFDTTFKELTLADPVSGWAWSAPVFQVLSVAYTPNHVIAVWPGVQKLSSPFGTAELRSELLRGSVVVEPGLALALDRTQLEGTALDLTGDGWRVAMDEVQIASRKAEVPEFAHDLHVSARGVLLPLGLREAVDPEGVLPRVFDRLVFNGVLGFDKDWDRHAVEGAKPLLTGVSVQGFEAVWGEMSITAQGRFIVDNQRFADGEITVEARDWRKMIKLAVEGGLMAADMGRTLERGLGFVAGFGGNKRVLKVPLKFSGGLTYLGPIPVGAAPRF